MRFYSRMRLVFMPKLMRLLTDPSSMSQALSGPFSRQWKGCMPDPREHAAEDLLRENERRADSLQQRLDELEAQVTTVGLAPDSEPAIRRRASRALRAPIELLPNEQPGKPILRLVVSEPAPQFTAQSCPSDSERQVAPAVTKPA